MVSAQCPDGYGGSLASGISLFAANPCGGVAAQSAALAGKAFSATDSGEAGAGGPGVLGWFYPDEADLHKLTGPTLPVLPSPEATGRLRFLTLSYHFYSRLAALGWGRGCTRASSSAPTSWASTCTRCRSSADGPPRRRLPVAAGARSAGRGPAHVPVDRGRPPGAVPTGRLPRRRWQRSRGSPSRAAPRPRIPAEHVDAGRRSRDRHGLALRRRAGARARRTRRAGDRGVGHPRRLPPPQRRVLRRRRQPFDLRRHRVPERPGLGGRPLGVLGEGRQVASSGDSFTDSFGPLAVHIYVAAP